MSKTLIPSLRQNRDKLRTRSRELLDLAERENRDLSNVERVEYDAAVADIEAIGERLEEILEDEQRSGGVLKLNAGLNFGDGDGKGGAKVTRESSTYNPDTAGAGVSYFGDLIRRQVMNDAGSHERLARYRTEVETERRDLSRTDGAGGEFVPPMWLVDQYAPFARAPRVVADLMTQIALPAGTDSINVPNITTGPQVAIQTADNAAVQETDMVSNSVSAPVRTIAGQQDVALQLLEQSPVAFDRIVFAELFADIERVLDQQLIAGTGASGQLQGILGLSGIGAITFTEGSPVPGEMVAPVTQAISSVMTNRLLPPEAILTNGREWAWAIGSLDSSLRPLVVPESSGPFNAVGTAGDLTMQGPVGKFSTLPMHISMNVPVNLGAGTNETRLIVGRFTDSYLYESDTRVRVLPDVGSATLTVRLQSYRYAAVAHRFPASYAVIAGTGCILQSGY